MCRVWNIQNYGFEQEAEPSTKYSLGDKQRAWDGIKPDDEESKQRVFVTHRLLIPRNFSFSNTMGIQKCTVILNNAENNDIPILSWAQPRCQVDHSWLGMKCCSICRQCWMAIQQHSQLLPSLLPLFKLEKITCSPSQISLHLGIDI